MSVIKKFFYNSLKVIRNTKKIENGYNFCLDEGLYVDFSMPVNSDLNIYVISYDFGDASTLAYALAC